MGRALRTPFILTISGFVMLLACLFFAIGNAYAGINNLPKTHEPLIISSAATLLFVFAIASECRLIATSTQKQRILLGMLMLLQGMILSFAIFIIWLEIYK
jgi:hypothetical protein